VASQYLEKGADGWVTYGGRWEGEIKFANVYKDERYSIVIDTQGVKAKVAEGVYLVDTRPQEIFTKSHLAGSINIPIIRVKHRIVEVGRTSRRIWERAFPCGQTSGSLTA
jgi:hypothetical protein